MNDMYISKKRITSLLLVHITCVHVYHIFVSLSLSSFIIHFIPPIFYFPSPFYKACVFFLPYHSFIPTPVFYQHHHDFLLLFHLLTGILM